MTFKEAKPGDHIYSVVVRHTDVGPVVLLREYEILSIMPLGNGQGNLLKVVIIETTQDSSKAFVNLVKDEMETILNRSFIYYGLSLENAMNVMKDKVDDLKPWYQKCVEQDFNSNKKGHIPDSLRNLDTFKHHTAMNSVRLMFNLKRRI